MLGVDVRDVRDVREVREVRDVRDVRDVREVRDVRDVRDRRAPGSRRASSLVEVASLVEAGRHNSNNFLVLDHHSASAVG